MRDVDGILTEWYSGEVGGKALFCALARAADTGAADTGAANKWRALAAVEDAVASRLSAALTARGIPVPRVDNVEGRARHRCEAIAEQTWPQTMQWLQRIAGEALVHMRADAATLPPELTALGHTVVLHEIALVAFADRELAGDPRSLEPIDAFVSSIE
jgi:hypothetical protein